MTNLQHDEVPDRTLNRSTASGKKGLSAAKAVLSIRLWSPKEIAPADNSFDNAPSAPVFLVLDLIAASGGVAETFRGSVLSAKYSDVQSAILTARRLQWALQGLAENKTFEGTTAAILVHSDEDASVQEGALPGILENAAGGQILLAKNICKFIDGLPGLLLRDASEDECREMLWRSNEMLLSYADDEQALLNHIHQLGLEDPSPAKLEARAAKVEVEAETPAFPPSDDPGDLIRPRIDRDSSYAHGNSRWLIWGGVAAALLCVAALSLISFRHKVVAQPTEPVTAPISPATPAVAPVAREAPVPQHAAPTPRPSSKPVNPDLKIQKPVGGACDFTQADIERTLGRAENYMHAGRLSDAQGAFQSVANCPTAREKAQDGLQRVRLKMETQSPSSTP